MHIYATIIHVAKCTKSIAFTSLFCAKRKTVCKYQKIYCNSRLTALYYTCNQKMIARDAAPMAAYIQKGKVESNENYYHEYPPRRNILQSLRETYFP